MATNRDYIQLIDRLTELTQSEELVWDRKNRPEKLESTDNKIDIVYESKFKDRNLRLYEEKYKHFTDEFDYYWSERVVLEFIDEAGGHIWQFPSLRNIWDLLKAIKFEDAGVDSFIKDVLDDL